MPGSVGDRIGRRSPGRNTDVARPPVPLVDFGVFWNLVGHLVTRIIKEKGHGEVSIVVRDGRLQYVKVDRTFLPGSLPEA